MKFLSPTEIRARALEDAAERLEQIGAWQGVHPIFAKSWDEAHDDPIEWMRNLAKTIRVEHQEYMEDTK